MPDSPAQRKSKESPKAAEAFAAYVAMGPSRSLRKLADALVAQNRYKTTTTALNSLRTWSAEFNWQERIATAASARADRMLEEAAELDADTFLRTSQDLNRRATFIDGFKVDEMIRVRESVRKPAPKGSTNVNVNVTVQVQQIVDRIAEEDGLTEDEKRELMESVQRHLSGATA